MKSKTSFFGIGLLLLAAVLWGFGFTAQSMALDRIGPYTLSFIRNLLAGIFLIFCIMLFDRKTDRRLFSRSKKGIRIDFTKTEIIGGVFCGVALCVASNLQQFSIAGGTDTGTAAFITSLYMIFVPIIGLFRGKFPSVRVWGCVIGALIGFYLLSANIVFTGSGIGGFFASLFNSGFRFAASDLLMLLGAVIFAVHIIIIDHFSPSTDGVRLSCIQVFTASLISLPLMLILERPVLSDILASALPILYLAVFSSGIAYTAQIVGQKHVDVTIASIVLSLESIFGALFGFLFLNETKNAVQTVGCLLVFAAVVISQLPSKVKESKSNNSENAN